MEVSIYLIDRIGTNKRSDIANGNRDSPGPGAYPINGVNNSSKFRLFKVQNIQ